MEKAQPRYLAPTIDEVADDAAAPAADASPSAARPRLAPALFACLGFAAYVAAVMLTRPVSPDAADSSLEGQLVGVGLITVLSAPFLGTSLRRIAEGSRRSSLLFHLFWLVTLAMVPFGVAPIYSFLYLLLTFGVYFSVGNIWTAPRWLLRATFLTVSGVCYYVCVRSATSFDLSPGRHLGLLTPNHFAAFALVPVLLSFVQPRVVQLAIYAASLALILYINARGALTSFFIYVAIFETALIAISHRRKTLVLLAAAAVLLGSSGLMVSLSNRHVGDRVIATAKAALAWDDPGRGLHSGFTGRAAGWTADNLAEFLVTGAGFRAAKYIGGAHSAWYSLVRESGVVGTAFFLVFLAVRLLQLTRCMFWRQLSIEERTVAAGILAGMAAIMFIAIFELWLLNIGFPIGACAMLFYAYYEPLPAEVPDAGRGQPRELPCPA